jgi:hypothetical protein
VINLLVPWSRVRPVTALACADLTALFLSSLLGVMSRVPGNPQLPIETYVSLLPFLGLMLVLFTFNRLYAAMPAAPSSELRTLAQTITSGFLLLAAWTFLTKDGEAYSRAAFITAWVLALSLIHI